MPKSVTFPIAFPVAREMRRRLVRWTALMGPVLLASAPAWVPATAHAADAAGQKTVAVMAIVEHPALDAVRDGTREALKAAGFEEGKGFRFVYQSAQGNTATAAQIARKFVGDSPDVIVAIATPAAQAAVSATRSIPVVYSAVTDPVAARLVKGMGPSGTNVTGVSDASPLERQIRLIREVKPQARRVGVVYSPGEANSVAIVNELKTVAARLDMTLVEAAAPRSVDVAGAAQSLVGKVDALYAPTDNNVMSAFEALVRVAQDARLPIVSADTSSVERGSVAALGLNYLDLGRQTGRMVARILKGEKPGAIASETSDTTELFLSRSAAQKQGATLSEALLRQARKTSD